MFRGGYWLLGRFRGVLVRLHWSILFGALLFSGFHPSLASFVAFPCLVLVHELGRALVTVRLGQRVVAIEASGFGGVCQWSGNAAPFEEALIAWGGVLAQLVLFFATELWLSSSFAPSSQFGERVAWTFTHANLYLVLVNLIPIPPLDGARAWTLFGAWNERARRGVPHGTWHDPSANAQRTWLDGARRKRSKPARPDAVSVARRAAAAASDEGELEPQNQRAVDDLLRRATGKHRMPRNDKP